MRISSRLKVNMAMVLVALLALSLTFFVSSRAAVQASSPNISVFPVSGPPNTNTQMSGKHFGASETVTLTIDTSISLGSATTDSTGAFSASVLIPKTALPGAHTITATGQTSGDTAQATYKVDTAWPMFGLDPAHSHYNNYENLVSPKNASTLTQDWNLPTGGAVQSSVTVDTKIAYVGSIDGKLYAFDAATV